MGRPVGGSAKVSLVNAARLPLRSSCRDVASKLGVSATTLRQWCLLHKLPHVIEKGVYVIEREKLVQWLVDTNRALPIDPATAFLKS